MKRAAGSRPGRGRGLAGAAAILLLVGGAGAAAQPEEAARPEEAPQPEESGQPEPEAPPVETEEAPQEATGEETPADTLPGFAETVVVTASRTETPLLTVPAAVTVRTAREAAAEAPRAFADLFEGIPGVSIQGNARRITETPNIRGFSDEQVVVRQDGGRQNFNGAHAGRFFTDPDLVERVEVRRGAASALYGSGALGGVVALTTRSARSFLEAGQRFGGRYRVGYQSNGRDRSQSFALFGATEAVEGLANLTLGGTREAIRDGNGDAIPNTEDRVRSTLLKLGWTPSAASRLELSYQGFDSDGTEPTNANSLLGTLVDRDTGFGGLRARLRFRPPESDHLDLNLLAYRNTVAVDERMVVETRHDLSSFETLGFEAANTARFGWGRSARVALSAGVETYRDRQSGTRDGAPRLQFPDAEVGYFAAFVHGEAEVGDHLRLSGGVRRDAWQVRADRFGERAEGQISPQGTVGLRLGDHGFLWAGAARGFRAPSLTEMYADGLHFQFPVGPVEVLNWFRPSPDLAAERGTSWETGVRGGRGALSFEGACFRQTVANYIAQEVLLVDRLYPLTVDPVTGAELLTGSTYNRSVSALLRGCEAGALVERPRFRIRLNGSLLDTLDRDGETTLANAPANSLYLLAGARAPSLGLEAGARILVAGERRQLPEGIEESGGYRVVDFFARYAPENGPLAGMDWTLALNNATDEYYAVFPAVVPQPGRSLRLSAAYRFVR